MRDHFFMKKRRVIFTGADGLAQTGASNRTLRSMIEQHRAGEITIHKIYDFRLGEGVDFTQYEEAA